MREEAYNVAVWNLDHAPPLMGPQGGSTSETFATNFRNYVRNYLTALPEGERQAAVDRLMQQIHPFHPQFHLGQEVMELNRKENGRFHVRTATGTTFDAGAVVIAGGVGCGIT